MADAAEPPEASDHGESGPPASGAGRAVPAASSVPQGTLGGQDERFDNPEPIHPKASPLLPRHLEDLFIHPAEFFSGNLALGRTPYLVFVTWCLGMSGVVNRLDAELLKAGLGGRVSAGNQMFVRATESWPETWAWILLLGTLSGLMAWGIGGWFFRLMIRWSGHKDPDPRMARLVFVYGSFVSAFPLLVVVALWTAVYPNYRVAQETDVWLSSALVVVPFWSMLVLYRGVRTVFEVSRWKARMLFLGLPVLISLAGVAWVVVLVVLAERAAGG